VPQLEFNGLAITYAVKKSKDLFRFGKLLAGILNIQFEFN
jgi:hypothetical protein